MGLVEVRTEHVCQRFKAPFFKKKMKSFLVKAFYLNFVKKASVSLISSLKIAQLTASFP